MRGALPRAVVGGRRGLDGDGRLGPAVEHRLAHLGDSGNGHKLDTCGRLERGRPAHQQRARAAPLRRLRKGIAHLAAGAVAQKSHRIERLPRGPGGHQHHLALQILPQSEDFEHAGDDGVV